MQKKHNKAKNPSWQEANQLAMYKPGQGSVLGTLIKNKTIWRSGQELNFRALHYSTHETLLICKLKPSLNMQSDSVCAKVFV